MKKFFLIAFGAVIMLYACNSSVNQKSNTTGNSESTEQTSINSESAKNEGNNNRVTELKKLIFDAKKLSKQEINLYKKEMKGEIVNGLRWEDNNGKNVVFFTEAVTKHAGSDDAPESADKELHAYHYKYNNDKYEIVREVKDFEKNCMFDMRARFIEESAFVTDLDKNGFAELTFVYRLGCTSELSPDGLKLIMLENGKKYAIRGNTEVDYGNENIGGETNTDEAFKEAPKEFLDFAKKIWKKNLTQSLAYTARKYMIEKLMKYKNAKIGGVEPSWSIELNEKNFVFKKNGAEDLVFEYEYVRTIPNGFAVEGHRNEGEATAYLYFNITEENCSDGMSENNYSLKIEASFNNQKFYGCGNL